MTDLSAVQQRIEDRALSRGISTYWSGTRQAQATGDGETLSPVKSLIATHVDPISDTVSSWCASLPSLRPQSKEAHSIVVIEEVGIPEASAICLVTLLRLLPRLPMPITAVCSSVGSSILAERGIATAADIEPALISSAIKKLSGAPSLHRAKVLRALARSVNKSPGHDAKLAFQIGYGMIQCLLRGTALFECRPVPKPGSRHVHHIIDVNGSVSDWIERALEAREEAGVRYPAMVMPPRPWMDGIAGGYRFALADKLSLFGRGRGTQVEPQTLDAINTIQRVAWRINAPVYSALRDLVFARTAVAGLAATHVDENTKPIYPEDRADDQEVVQKWRREARDWHYSRAQAVSAAASAASLVTEADSLSPRSGVYFPHRLDFRTRVYSATSALSTQGADQPKGILQFSDGVPIGDGEGPDWLAIHGANCMAKCPMSGAKLDKAPFADRIAWVHRNHNMLQAIAADWRSTLDLWTVADTPFQFLAFAQEWAGFMEHGPGFETHIPIALDGSCNGLQHYAALMKDPKTAAAVNLLPGAAPSDVYQKVADAFIAHLIALAEEGMRAAVPARDGTMWKRRTEVRINRIMQAFSMIFRYAKKAGWIAHRPEWERNAKADKKRRLWTCSEAQELQLIAFFEATGLPDMADLTALYVDTGARNHELTYCSGEGYKPGRDRVPGTGRLELYETKGGEPRAIPLTKRAEEIIQRRIAKAGNGRLFKGWYPDKVSKKFADALQLLGIVHPDACVHGLRHTFGTRAAERGMHPMALKEIMGHVRIETTMIYVKMSAVALRKAMDDMMKAAA